MAHIDTADLISITDASKIGISGLIRDAEEGHERVFLRNNRPVAVVMSIEKLNRLQSVQEDMLDVSLATARLLTTGPARHSLDEVLDRFGYTRDQLLDIPD